jgi:hypothetical protein
MQHPTIRGRNILNQNQRSNGNLSGMSAYFFNHAHRLLVKYSLPDIYQETIAGILTQHLLKNVKGPIVETHPKPLLNKPYGINCWRLLFVADGMIGRGSIIYGEGDKPNKIWSKPNSSVYTLRYRAVSCTHLVLISLSWLKREFRRQALLAETTIRVYLVF